MVLGSSAYWLVMTLPFAVINFCDDRGRHCAFSQLELVDGRFLIRARFTCVAAIVMMDVMVVTAVDHGRRSLHRQTTVLRQLIGHRIDDASAEKQRPAARTCASLRRA